MQNQSLLLRFQILILFTFSAWGLPAQTVTNLAATPATRDPWIEQHQNYNALAAKGNIDLLFIGDSITQGWRGNGTPVWDKYFASKQAANFGLSGDRTENLLWRLQNGNLNGIRPKVVVVLIGTNNIWRDKPEQIAEAIGLIVQEIKTRCPSSRVLLLGIFPRGDAPNTPTRKKITQVNTIISNLHDGKQVFYLDIGEKLTNPEGAISKDIMFDFTHLTATGYQIWADAIGPKLDELMR